MAFPNFDAWRELLPAKVRLSADDHAAQMQGYLGAQHAADGSHTDITADSIDTGPVSIASNDWWISLYRENALGNRTLLGRVTQEAVTDGSTILLDAEGSVQVAVKVHDLDAMRLGVVPGTSVAEQQFFNALAARGSFRLQQSTWNCDPPVPILADDFRAPLYSAYALTVSGNQNIFAINTQNAVDGARGQLLLLWNDSAYNLTFQHDTTGTAGMRLLCPHGANLAIGPQGTTLWRYDTAAQRWRCLGYTGQTWAFYTPAWTSTATQPALVNGVITGLFQRLGGQCHFVIQQFIGSADTFGTGLYHWSVPIVPIVGGLIQPSLATAYDPTTTLIYAGMTQPVSTSALHVFPIKSAGSLAGIENWNPTSPFTWAANAQLCIQGSYFIG